MEETFYIRNGGSDMPVFVRGNGASKTFILILHGGPGDGGLVYGGYPYSEALEDKYAIIYWDQRHQGNSHGHLKKADMTVDALVEDTRLLVRTLKQRYGEDISLFLFGHSWGGLLGTAYMIKENYQDDISGWIEVAGAYDFPQTVIGRILMIKEHGPEEIALGNNEEKWQKMIDYVSQIDTANISDVERDSVNNLLYQLEELIDYRINDYDKKNNKEYFEKTNNSVLRVLMAAGLAFIEDFYIEIGNTELTKYLPKIRTPSLILYGKYDANVPPLLGEVAYEKIGTLDKELVIYQHSGHIPFFSESNLFIQDVINFIDTYK